MVDYQGRLVDLVEQVGEPSPDLVRELAALEERVGEAWDRPIGEASSALRRSWSTPSDLGTWITSQMQRKTGADVAVYNSGGLRADLPAGAITRRDLFQVFPFGNTLTSFTISGSELERLLRRAGKPPGDAGALRSAMAELASNEPLRRTLGEAARRRVEERFTVEVMVDRHLDLCERVVGGAA